MSASADVLAQAKVEIGLGTIPEGKNVRLMPCFCGLLATASRMATNVKPTIGHHQVAWQARFHPSPYPG